MTDILRHDAAGVLLLLSREGNLLYGGSKENTVNFRQQVKLWRSLIDFAEKPREVKLVFNSGSCYLSESELGFIVVILHDYEALGEIEALCVTFSEKLSSPVNRKELLLQLFDRADEQLKLPLLNELSSFVDQEIGEKLISLLAGYKKLQAGTRDNLLQAVCRLLGNCSCKGAREALSAFLQNYSSAPGEVNQQVVTEARVSLKQLEFGAKPAKRNNSTVKAMQNKENIPQNGAEQRIRQLLAEGKKKEAVAIIMKYIEALASRKMFAKAESLRDTLIKIDSMMLNEIVKAAEIIEEHKAAAIAPEHLKIWTDLRELLEKEEFSALYHSLTLQRCSNGEIVVEQGTLRPQLIFLNTGKVQVYTSVDDREVPIKIVGAGEVIGGGTFFEPSVWTTSVRSLGAEIFLFPRKHMNQLKSQYPSLESKLFDFSARFTSANTIFRESRKSRRQYERKTIAGRATAALLKNDGAVSGVAFKGDLFDISRGGISFCVRISKKEKANLLFGTKIRVGMPPGPGRIAGGNQITYAGKIVAVRAHHAVGNEYSIHVEFDNILSSGELQQVLGTN